MEIKYIFGIILLLIATPFILVLRLFMRLSDWFEKQ